MPRHFSIDKTITVSKLPKRTLRKKALLITLLILAFSTLMIAITSIVVVVMPAQRMYDSFQNILSVTDSLKLDLQDKDLSNIDGYVERINDELAVIDEELNQYEFLKDIEFTKGYYNNLQIIRELSNRSGELMSGTLPELKVLLGSLGYTVSGVIPSEVLEDTEVEVIQEEKTNKEEGTEEQIKSLIQELPKIVSLYDENEQEIIELVELFNQLDPDFIPEVGGLNAGEKIRELQIITEDFPTLSAQLKNTLRMLPDLLGANKKTRYLVIFQNEKEMRSSGGLLSAFGTVTINKGELVGDIEVTDMWDLEGYVSWTLGLDTGNRNIYGQNYLMNRGCGSTYLRAQDSGIYPDLHVTMETFRDYYDLANKFNKKKYPSYDHIVIINTFFASDLVSLVEPIKVPGFEGGNINSKNVAKKIFMETSTATFDPAVRKKFIGEVATVAKEKFINMSSSDFPKFIQTFVRTIQAKNVAFYSKDKDMQAYFDEFGLSGRIEHNFAGDYFHLNEAQNCSLKINFYLEDEVTQNININKVGRVFKDVKVKWINKQIFNPAEKHVYSNLSRFSYRAWVRIMAPKGTNFTDSDGFIKSGYLGYLPVEYFDKVVKKAVSDNVIQFDHRRLSKQDPVKTHFLNVSYTLPKSLNYTAAEGYRQLIQKHPGKDDERYKINITHQGKTTSVNFVLDRDKVVTFKNGVIKVEPFDTRLDDYYDLAQSLIDN